MLSSSWLSRVPVAALVSLLKTPLPGRTAVEVTSHSSRSSELSGDVTTTEGEGESAGRVATWETGRVWCQAVTQQSG